MIELDAGKQSWKIQGIIFDKDGTLLDFGHMWGNWSLSLLDQLRLLDASVDWEGVLGLSLKPDGVDFDPHGPLTMAANAEIRAILAWQLYQGGWPWNKAISQVSERIETVNGMMEQSRPVRPLPGLQAFLSECRKCGLVLGVVTSDETAFAVKHLRWLGIREYFQVVIGSDQVPFGKPHPLMLQMALAKLGLRPQQAVMIGDTAADMQMANSAGMAAAIGIHDGSAFPAGADAGIHSYEELTFRKEEG